MSNPTRHMSSLTPFVDANEETLSFGCDGMETDKFVESHLVRKLEKALRRMIDAQTEVDEAYAAAIALLKNK